MARRQLLSNEAWSARLAPAVDDREVIRHYTLSEDDFDGIMRKRLDASRLGYALALCLMRHPGAPLNRRHRFRPFWQYCRPSRLACCSVRSESCWRPR